MLCFKRMTLALENSLVASAPKALLDVQRGLGQQTVRLYSFQIVGNPSINRSMGLSKLGWRQFTFANDEGG